MKKIIIGILLVLLMNTSLAQLSGGDNIILPRNIQYSEGYWIKELGGGTYQICIGQQTVYDPVRKERVYPENAISLKGTQYQLEINSDGTHLIDEVIDYNYTGAYLKSHIRENELDNKNVRAYVKRGDEIIKEYQNEYSYSTPLTRWYSFTEGEELHIGETSTVIKLYVADHDNLGDAMLKESQPANNFTAYTYIYYQNESGSNEYGIYKFNITPIYSVCNFIDNARIHIRFYGDSMEGGEYQNVSFYRIYDSYKWEEDNTITWNSRPTIADYNSSVYGGFRMDDATPEWKEADITELLAMSLQLADQNISLYGLASDNIGSTPDESWTYAKEYSGTASDPILNITCSYTTTTTTSTSTTSTSTTTTTTTTTTTSTIIAPSLLNCSSNQSIVAQGNNITFILEYSPGSESYYQALFFLNGSDQIMINSSGNLTDRFYKSYNTSNLSGNYTLNCTLEDISNNWYNTTDETFLVTTTTTTSTTITTTTLPFYSSVNITLISPLDGALLSDLNATLTVRVYNNGSSLINVTFYDVTTGTVILGVCNDVANNSEVIFNWSGLIKGATYLWRAKAKDKFNESTSGIWDFTIDPEATTTIFSDSCGISGAYVRIKIEDLAFLGVDLVDLYNKADGRYIRTINISQVNKFYDDCDYLIYPRGKVQQYLSYEPAFNNIFTYLEAYLPQILIVVGIFVIISLTIIYFMRPNKNV